MILSYVYRFFRADLHFLAISYCLWLGYFALLGSFPRFQMDDSSDAFVSLFALEASVITFFILKFVDYFDRLRPLPRKYDLVLVFLAFPLGAALTHLTVRAFFNDAVCASTDICGVKTLLTWSPLMAPLAFGFHYLVNTIRFAYGRKIKIVVDVAPAEKQKLVYRFMEAEMDRYIQFIGRQELKDHLLRGDGADIDLIIISRNVVSQFEEDGLLIRAHLAGIPIRDEKTVSIGLSGRVDLADADLWSYVLGATPQTLVLQAYTTLKIVVEPLIAVVLGILFAPIMLVLCVLQVLTSKGPIFYKQVRTGYLRKELYIGQIP